MKEVEIWESEPRTGSYLLAEGLDRPHDHVRKLIENYREDFEDFSDLKSRKLKSTGGRPAVEYMLDEDQFMFLGTLLKNTPKVVAFKKAIVQQFKKARLILQSLQQHKATETYQITRTAGKIVRRETTDTMKAFTEYAISQGSQNAERYYSNITKMLNTLLFVVHGKFKNLREVLTIQQLMTVSSAENIVSRGLEDGMNKKKYYKDIYQDVKARVQLFVDLHGKSEVVHQALLMDGIDL